MKHDADFGADEIKALSELAGFHFDAADEGLASVTPRVWMAIQAFNGPPFLFRYADKLVRLETDCGAVLLNPLTAERMAHVLARAMSWYKFNRTSRQRRRRCAPSSIR